MDKIQKLSNLECGHLSYDVLQATAIILEVHAVPIFTSTLKMETPGCSETLVNTYRNTWHHNPENHNLNFHSNFIQVIPDFGTYTKLCLMLKCTLKSPVSSLRYNVNEGLHFKFYWIHIQSSFITQFPLPTLSGPLKI